MAVKVKNKKDGTSTVIKNSVAGFLNEYTKKNEQKIVSFGLSDFEDPPRLPSGIFQFDYAVGGGIPLGRCTVLFGTEGGMKTTLALKLIAQAQARFPDKKAVFVDAEGHFSKKWAAQMGVDTDALVYILPQTAEQIVDIVEGVVQAEDVSIVVVDSLAAMITNTEINKGAEEALVGTTGLVINKLYRKSTSALNAARAAGRYPALVLINQIRFKIGVMMGNPETMPGGPAFKFASSMTIRLSGKDEFVKETGEDTPAFRVLSMRVTKWKVPIMQTTAEIRVALKPIPQYSLKIGETYDWGTIKGYLDDLGLLQHVGKQWVVTNATTGEAHSFDKQDEIRDRLFNDKAFGMEIRDMLAARALMQYEKIDPSA